MSTPDKDRVNRLVLELLAENPDDAAVALFTRLCRQSPKLRAWLWDEFAGSAKTRAEFARILAQTGKADNLTLAHAAGEDRARDLENVRVRGQWATESTLRPYGGLSRPEVEGGFGAISPGRCILPRSNSYSPGVTRRGRSRRVPR